MVDLNCRAENLGTKTIHAQEYAEKLDDKIAKWCAENPDLTIKAINYQFAGNEYSSARHFVAFITWIRKPDNFKEMAFDEPVDPNS
jgi:hypothetical protein